MPQPAALGANQCLLWVMSRHSVTYPLCPLFPSKRTFVSAVCTSA